MQMSNTDALRKSAEYRANAAFQRSMNAIQALVNGGRQVTFASVSEQAGVSRTYLYGHQELRQLINKYRVSTGESRDASMAAMIKLLRVEVARLERELKQAKTAAEKVEALEKENQELRKQLRTAYKY